MASLNQVNVMGNLCRDVELRFTPSGAAIASLSLAINSKYKDKKTNEMREDVTYVDVQLWNKTAELANQYLAKGSQVLIVGRLKLDQWTDKNTGAKRSKLFVLGDQMHFVGAKKEGAGGGQTQQSRPAQGKSAPPPKGQEFGVDEAPMDLDIQEENVPF